MAAVLEIEFIEEAVACSIEGCVNDSSVYISSAVIDCWDTPFCSVCASLKFSQWMVAMHLGPAVAR